MKLNSSPIYIAMTGLLIFGLFLILPMNPGYELALAFVPMFFISIGLILALIYWLLSKYIKKDLGILFFIFFFGNLTWGTLLAIDMAYDTFGF